MPVASEGRHRRLVVRESMQITELERQRTLVALKRRIRIYVLAAIGIVVVVFWYILEEYPLARGW